MSVPTNEFQRPPTAQEAVAEELRRQIVAGELRPGVALRQDEIAKSFGVSRVPVREALKTLQAEDLVSYVPHRGYCVALLEVEDVVEILTVRGVLEADALRRAIDQLTEDDLDRIRATLQHIDDTADSADLLDIGIANRRFHTAILEPCRMPRMMKLIKSLMDSTEPYRPIYYMDSGPREGLQEDHREIVQAMEARDADRAVKLLIDHRETLIESVRNIRAFEPVE